MLILNRKPGQSFLLGDNIQITVLSVESNGTVSLGIDAPQDVLILRSELKIEAAEANRDAADAAPGPVEALGAALSGKNE